MTMLCESITDSSGTETRDWSIKPNCLSLYAYVLWKEAKRILLLCTVHDIIVFMRIYSPLIDTVCKTLTRNWIYPENICSTFFANCVWYLFNCTLWTSLWRHVVKLDPHLNFVAKPKILTQHPQMVRFLITLNVYVVTFYPK